MGANEHFKEDLRTGRIEAQRLIDLIDTLQQQLRAAHQRIVALEQQLAGTSGSAKLAEPFSVRAEEQRQQARGPKQRRRKGPGRRGRGRTADKVARAERTEDVYPVGVPARTCWLSHTRPVWRLEKGRAVLLAYRVYRGPNNRYGKIPGVLGRSEFGLEIVVAIAYQVYVVGLSFDKVCLLLSFFQGLQLRKAQADALLQQLARHWRKEFDVLCTLLANSSRLLCSSTSSFVAATVRSALTSFS